MHYKRTLLIFIAATLASLLTIPKPGNAQQLIYRPTNPAFGGNPYNYQWLMSSANTQNQHKESSSSRFQRDPLADFQQSLQRQILSELTRNLVRDKFGENFDYTKQNSFEFGEFSIEVVPGIDGVTIRIFNILSGEQTSITIPNIDG